ncbi:MAG: TonB-dependent receptor [Balneolales bacterium]
MKRTYQICIRGYKTVLFTLLILFSGTVLLNASNLQEAANNENGITGRVLTSEGIPVPNVNISVKGTAYATKSDENGLFTLEADAAQPVLVFQKDEYHGREIDAGSGDDEINVVLEPIDYVNLIWGKQQAENVSASVSRISGDELINLPGYNRNNVLGGRLTGLTVQQSNGTPGLENSSLYVRGLKSLSNNTALVIVDGYVRPNADYLGAHDIESVTVHKDAAATAIYGMRGGAGVVEITTKRGKDEPLSVNFDSHYGFQEATRTPNYLGSHDYAYLYNEASRNDGGTNLYSSSDLASYADGTDIYGHPNVNWRDEFLRDYTSTQRYNLSARGGSEIIRYFASFGYANNNGIYDVDNDANLYSTNQDFDSYNLRTNVDMQVHPRVMVKMDIGIQQQEFNYPGPSGSMSNIMTSLYQLPPNAHPVFNEDGSLAGTTQYTQNPYGLINNSGYTSATTRSTDASFNLIHDWSALTEGLSARGSVGFDGYFTHNIERNKEFYVYEGSLGEDNIRGDNNQPNQRNASNFSGNQRVIDVKAGFDYERTFGSSALDGTAFFNQNTFSTDGNQLAHVYQGVMGRMNYAYNNRYLAGFSFAYQGSEQTGDNNRYIFYPAVSLGWIISEESFLNESNSINFLKIRGSHGLTGDDRGIGYFQKFSFFERGGSYLFGTNLSSQGGYREGILGTPNIRPETTRKSNLGVDATLFGDRISFSGDVFFEKTTDIITELNQIPSLLGTRIPTTGNAGIVENRGFELSLGYGNNGNDFKYSLTGNFSYAKNKVIDMQEQDYPYDYNYRTGQPLGSIYGLESIGFFYDDAEVNNSPDQSAFGSYGPGDLKYRDLNDDGTIDIDDFSKIGKSWMPEIVYGVNLNLEFKGVDFSALLEGIGNADRMLGNYAYYDFYPNTNGNLMEHHLDRWAYDPTNDIDTRDTAKYPRLSLEGDNTNSKQPNSTFWLRDASYLRVKSIELGYSLPGSATSLISLSGLRVFATVYNAFTFDKIDVVDPEVGNGAVYPIQRMMNFGINAQF